MSLENQIAALNDNLSQLLKILQTGSPAPAPTVSAPAKAARSAKTNSDKQPAEAAPAALADTHLDFKRDVGPLVLEVASKLGRDEATAILQRFGVAKASALSADQWPALIEECRTALAGQDAPAARLL